MAFSLIDPILAQDRDVPLTTIAIIAAVSIVAILVIVFLIFFFRYIGLWIRAFFTRAKISPPAIVFMALRGVNPQTIVNAKITSVQAGLVGITTKMPMKINPGVTHRSASVFGHRYTQLMNRVPTTRRTTTTATARAMTTITAMASTTSSMAATATATATATT